MKDPDEFRARADPAHIGDPLDRSRWSLEALLQRPVPPRDYLLDGMLSTTSRWLINGETGVGKTLVGIDLANAIRNGARFLSWNGGRPCKVGYFDGELPFETLKERLELTNKLYGGEHGSLTVYTRDVIDADGEEMLPFNTPEGQEWLWREIERNTYDAIVLDNIMTLTAGAMDTEEAWRVMPPLMRRISAARCAQIWLHHTGHDSSRGYGTKTREWNMDTVIHLSKEDPEAENIQLEFRKARLRKPDSARLFAPVSIRRTDDGWTTENAPATAAAKASAGERKRTWFLECLDELAGGVAATRGHTGEPVHKVALSFIRELMRKRGFLETDDNGKIPATERKAFQRAREDLLAAKKISTDSDFVWRI